MRSIKPLLAHFVILSVLFLISCTSSTPIIDANYGPRAGTWQWSSENDLSFSALSGGQLKSNNTYVNRMMDFYQNHRRQGFFEGEKGVKIYYDVFENPQEKSALVISPGNGEASIRYAELVYDLMNQNLGYSIYIINHRGQGFSERLMGDARSWETINKANSKAIEEYQKAHIDDFQFFVDDLKKFIDTVVKPETHAKSFGLGYSLGGSILTRYLELNPGRLTAVALSSPMYKYGGTVTDMASQTFAANRVNAGKATEYVLGQEGPYDPSIPFIDQGKVNSLTTSRNRFDLRKFIVQENPGTALGGKTWGWMNETLKNIELIRKYATKVRVPVLMLQASDDQLIDLNGHQEVCTAINQNVETGQATLCKLIRFPSAQHELLIEKDDIRNRVLDEIVTFFKQYQ
ncbi:MAG: hypothetical protein BWK79_08520 [Beggiatoa sp. IS2]|nr:MAG: hypothetical protein BWK79_08520 [Beggiatoa sp. IS2]